MVISDGPRANRPGEAAIVQETREIATSIDWDCELFTNFSDANLGCRERIQSGLDWAFGLVEEAIILEDDCLPEDSFFTFVSSMLREFRETKTVGMVSGTNYIPFHAGSRTSSYYFSKYPHIWGWGTWSDRWALYQKNAETWDQEKYQPVLREVFPYTIYRNAWTSILNGISNVNTWDYQWAWTFWYNDWLSIVPNTNLVTNIGLNGTGTHTTSSSSHPQLRTGQFLSVKNRPLQSPARNKLNDFIELTYFRVFSAQHMNLQDWIRKVGQVFRSP